MNKLEFTCNIDPDKVYLEKFNQFMTVHRKYVTSDFNGYACFNVLSNFEIDKVAEREFYGFITYVCYILEGWEDSEILEFDSLKEVKEYLNKLKLTGKLRA